ncbi:MAG: tetratricopeptide repeat protein, partial [Verrucomicrobiota bacterium]
MAISKPQDRSSCLEDKGVVSGVCLLLAIAVFLVFDQTLHFGFVNFDDDVYVYQNPQVVQGLTLHGIGWAFTHIHNANWHPLVMMSLMLDAQIYGLKAGGYHLTNILLHGATAILLFLVLRRMTGMLWPSAFVAAVFAILPLRVESVAWVTERKDVLSGLFFVLTLWAYGRYVEKSEVRSPKSKVWYGLTMLFFTLGLLSKPTLVTVPFVLLLLDYWPLGRVAGGGWRVARVRQLLLEKLPLFGLAAVFSLVTFITQKKAGALAALERQPLAIRWENALANYAVYLSNMFWPDNLAALYPRQAASPAWEIMVAGGLLLLITVLVVAFARRFPYLVTGWLWYLGMLVPMIGIVQAGFVTRADRFTYLPQIGLCLIIAWTIKDLTASWRYRRQLLGVAALAVIVALMIGAWKQTSYWRDSESLWTRTLDCTSDNAFAHLNLGLALGAEGRLDEAIEHFQKAAEIGPLQAQAYNDLGIMLVGKGRLDEAVTNFARAVEIQPDYAAAHLNWGAVLATQGKTNEAIALFQRAIELKPDYADAHYNLARELAAQGKTAEAIGHYQRAIQLQPESSEVFYNLGIALAAEGKLAEAVEQYQKAIQLKPDYADAHGNLANVLAAQGRLEEAIKEYQRTLELVPDSAQAHFRYGQALQAQRDFKAAITEYQRTIELNPRHV